MDVLADACALGDGCDDGLTEVLRMRAREADTVDSLDRVARTQQLAELGTKSRREISPPRVDVLAEQRDLANPVAREGRHFRDDLSGPPTLLPAAYGRDD